MTADEWTSLKKGDRIITPAGNVRTIRRVHFWKNRPGRCGPRPRPGCAMTGCVELENGVVYCKGDRLKFEIVTWRTR